MEHRENKTTSLEELLEREYGPVGTPRRDAFELKVQLLAERHGQPVRPKKKMMSIEKAKFVSIYKAYQQQVASCERMAQAWNIRMNQMQPDSIEYRAAEVERRVCHNLISAYQSMMDTLKLLTDIE